MSAAAGEAARLAAPARGAAVRARTRPARRLPAEQRRVAGGVVAIALLAVLLAGVVALNVAVLRLNLRLQEVDAARTKLRAENVALSSRLSSAVASPRIETLARARGLVQADPGQTLYIRLGERRRR